MTLRTLESGVLLLITDLDAQALSGKERLDSDLHSPLQHFIACRLFPHSLRVIEVPPDSLCRICVLSCQLQEDFLYRSRITSCCQRYVSEG